MTDFECFVNEIYYSKNRALKESGQKMIADGLSSIGSLDVNEIKKLEFNIKDLKESDDLVICSLDIQLKGSKVNLFHRAYITSIDDFFDIENENDDDDLFKIFTFFTEYLKEQKKISFLNNCM